MLCNNLMRGAAGAALLAFVSPALAQSNNSAIETVTVTAEQLNSARSGIQTQLGASTYTVTAADLADLPGGDNSALNSVILQMPDVAQDSFGQFHVRGEHNALQYRIDGIILPEGISVFGQTLDPRLAQSVELITGALPAEYGLETGGIVDIETKSGLFDTGGHVSMYGGSHNELEPSFDYGGSSGNLNYFISGDYNDNSLGIESPDNAHTPEHDRTKQWHGFAFVQDILDQNSSITAILGTSNAMFEIPNIPGEQPGGGGVSGGVVGLGPQSATSGLYELTLPNGSTQFLSDNLDERQREITHYGTVSYLRSQGDLTWQLSVFGRYSSLYYTPGSASTGQNLGDLLYDGISQTAYKRDEAYGTQDEGSYKLGDSHMIRFGAIYQADDLTNQTSSLVLPTAAAGTAAALLNPNPLCASVDAAYSFSVGANSYNCQIPGAIETIPDSSTKHAWSASVYIQDEWTVTPSLTVNYGVRYDQYEAYSRGDQISPRINSVWIPFDGTTLHIGYSRYFSPPPIELVSSSDVAIFNNTTAQPAISTDTTPLPERADYYDAGVSQKLFGSSLKVGLDSFYKLSKDMIDEGQFGAPIILTPFNYAHGRQYGAELTLDYTSDNFTAYANYSLIHAIGEDWVTSQFNFTPLQLAYVANNYIDLDHESLGTGSAGASYKWENTIFSVDNIYGYGLRDSVTLPSGFVIPNGTHTAQYVSTNLGISHDLADIGWDGLTIRADVINVFDVDYQIRNGTGVGVFAPQYGAHRGFFFGLSKAF